MSTIKETIIDYLADKGVAVNNTYPTMLGFSVRDILKINDNGRMRELPIYAISSLCFHRSYLFVATNREYTNIEYADPELFNKLDKVFNA